MAQRLIVEGNDAIVLTELCIKRGLKPPRGYSSYMKYKKEFVKPANGIDKVKFVLAEELESPDVSNIGIIVDANDVGVEGRFNSLKTLTESILDIEFPDDVEITNGGFQAQLMDKLSLGIWVMPNNNDNGYLEHFVSSLISEEDELWKFANAKVEELNANGLREFSLVKKQKALLHTYLSWKSTPGLPLGTAVKSDYINALSPNAELFVSWFESVFDLDV